MAKFPSKLGACIDLAYTARAERIDKQREFDAVIEEMKSRESEIKDHIINTFAKSDIDGAKGSICSASITRSVVPHVKDWPLVYKFIEKTKAWDLMERRMNKTAFRDRLTEGVKIPGVEAFEMVDLSLTKIGEKK
jgi:hypothetical protein